ncbi:MAG: DUF2330 domain-containing protein [Polyangiaceae bacterium]
MALLTSAMVSVIALAHARDARACGGCFHAATDTSTSFVSDHRMVVSISKEQTVLWDQVRFTGAPSEFAWVLPVRDGARVELARDEWIQLLDTATQPSVKGPDIACANGASGGSVGGGCSSTMSMSAPSSASSDFGSADGGAYRSGAGVDVVSQSVVGPYDAVIVRSSKGEAVHLWLRLNGFSVPDAIEPILSTYSSAGFDFLALKLRPQTGTSAMQPVRVVMPGAGSTLPLRMVAAGAGAKVGLTLFVISEGRYAPKNFPEAILDLSSLAWDPKASRSNYRDLVAQAYAATGGRGWMTEYAGELFASSPSSSREGAYGISGSRLVQPLESLYHASCLGSRATATCPTTTLPFDAGAALGKADASASDDGGASEGDGGVDGAPDASATPDASDAASRPPPLPTPSKCDDDPCAAFDDDRVALTGLHRSDVWVTRLRAELSPAACAEGDLELTPASASLPLPATLQTQKFTDPSFNPCGGIGGAGDDDGCACRTSGGTSSAPPVALALLGLFAVMRGRGRRR